MKKALVFIALLAMLLPFGSVTSQATSHAAGEASSLGETWSGMPPRPIPEKPIPHHDVGKPSRAAGYSTQISQVDLQGVTQTYTLTGLDALLADGVISDPFAGNYRLVELEKIMTSVYQGFNNYTLQTYDITPTLDLIPGSEYSLGNYWANDIAAGDLNGDDQLEQLAAWIAGTGEIYLSTGEMPGALGRTTSAPAAISHGTTVPDGWSLEFNGSNKVNAAGQIDLANASFTIAFWARRNAINRHDWILGQGTSDKNKGLNIGFRVNSFSCGFHSNDLDTPAFTDTDWHHWACTYDAGTNLRRIYRDGVMVAQDIAPADYQGSGVLTIGDSPSTHSNIQGLVDQVGIWGAPRTADQIKDDMIRPAPDAIDLMAYWPFDEGSGDTTADISGNDHDGTLVNDPVWNPENAPQGELGEIHLLVRGYDDALWHCNYDLEDSRACLNWENATGGTLLSAPAVASLGEGQFDVFAIGTDNQVYRRHWEGYWEGDWQPVGDWPHEIASWGGPTPELPPLAVVARGGGFDLFRLGPDNTLFWHDGTSWQSLGGMLASGPGAVSPGADHMQVFARGMDEALWYLTYSSGSWGSWQRLELNGMDEGVTIASAPTVVSPAPNQIEVYVRGSDNQLWKLTYDDSTWGTWTSLGGPLASGVAVAEGIIFAQAEDGSLQNSSDGLTWDGLASLPAQRIYDTGLQATAPDPFPDPYPLDNYLIDIETGYFTGERSQQIAVAYMAGPGDLYNKYNLALLDVHDGFKPYKLADLKLPFDTMSIRITAADVNADGIEEIALVHASKSHYRVIIYDTQVVDGAWSLVEMDHSPLIGPTDFPFAGTLRIDSGDLNGDEDDEVVVLTDWAEVTVSYPRGYEYKLKTHLYIYDDEDPAATFADAWLNHGFYYEPGSTWDTGLGLAVGDVNADGVDEIVRTWPKGFDGGNWPYLYREIQILDARDLTDLYHLCDPRPVSYNNKSYLDTLAVGDLDRDLKDEIVFYQDNELSAYELVYEVDHWVITPLDSKDNIWVQPLYVKLVTGDFTGESLRVGPPSYRVQSQMVSPEVFLNLPPMHRDIVKNASGEYIEINIDSGAQAIHSAGNTSSATSKSESKREWSLSTGFDLEVGGGGHKVKTSLENTYGENFSTSTTKINTIEFEDTTTAAYYDQLIYNGTNYAIWEYPVYGAEADNPDQAQTISVVFPLVSTTNQPTTQQGRLCDENFYAPSHQTYNVWSYDPLGAETDFSDFGTLIDSKQTSGGTDISVSMSEVGESMRSSSFNNQISAGLEYSYENEMNIPLIGKAWDFSFRAYAKGSYGFEEISTLSTSFTEESNVAVNFPGDPDPSNYTIKAYLYWAKGGYLVVDYQTNPVSSAGSWELYTETDPAFILPWYGFPDTDGGFPHPPNPDAPPCGLDKQLFTHDIQLDPGYVQNGDTLTMTATVRNFSNVNPPSNVSVQFYLGDPAGGNSIGSCTIPSQNLDRDLGPQHCSTTWVVSGGSGEEKVYAVIDPSNAFEEMHDENDVINNNTGYGLLYVASADHCDPGLREAQPYQTVIHEQTSELGFGFYIPTTNMTETIRYELIPISIDGVRSVGSPIQVLAFRGGESEPDESHTFNPAPAGLMAFYRDADLLPDMEEVNLKLYRLNGHVWGEATCPGYGIVRFPQDNLLAVPVCQTGVFVLSDEQPASTFGIFLPLVNRQ